jgi:hypothetical protein
VRNSGLQIDLFAHFATQEFRQAYLSIPLGAKGRRLDSARHPHLRAAQKTTDIDVLWDIAQRLEVLDRHGIDLQVLTLSFPMVEGLDPEEELRLARLANDGLAEIVQRHPHRFLHRFLGVATLPFSSPAEALALAEPRGMRPLVAHCHLGLGKLYRRTGTREQAQEHLTTATTMYREMDMRFWLEKAEAEVGSGRI